MAGGALQSATGFGFSLIASPVLVGAYGGATGISTLTVVSIVVNVLTLATERRRPAGDWRRAGVLVAWFVPGAVLGALVLRVADQELVELLVAGSVLAAIAARVLPAAREVPVAAAPAGLLGGAFGMSTGISGPPMVLHLLHTGASPARTRDTLAVVFLCTGVLALPILAAVGILGLPAATPLLLAAAAAGQVLGRRVFGHLDAVTYERVVLATMACSAVATVVLVLT